MCHGTSDLIVVNNIYSHYFLLSNSVLLFISILITMQLAVFFTLAPRNNIHIKLTVQKFKKGGYNVKANFLLYIRISNIKKINRIFSKIWFRNTAALLILLSTLHLTLR